MEYNETRKARYLISEYERLRTKANNIDNLIDQKVATRDRLNKEIREHRNRVKALDKELSSIQSEYDKNQEKFLKSQKKDGKEEKVAPEQTTSQAEPNVQTEAPIAPKGRKKSGILSKVKKLSLPDK